MEKGAFTCHSHIILFDAHFRSPRKKTMPKRALIESRPWLLGSIALAVAWVILHNSPMPDLTMMFLQAAPLVLLAIYAGLRYKGNDTRSLAGMLILQGVGAALLYYLPIIALNMLMVAYLIGLSMFLMHRTPEMDTGRKVSALALTLGTPLLCYYAAQSAGISMPLFLGLALGGMAASAWISTFSRSSVGLGAALIVTGNVLAITGFSGTAPLIAFVAWPLIYVGNLVLAISVAGELRMRQEYW